MRALRKGLSGNDVRQLQYILKNKYGQNISVDGGFGPATDSAVRNVQRQLGLSVDGSIGPATQAKIGLTDFIVDIYDKSDVFFAGTKYDSQRKTDYPVYTAEEWAKRTGADIVYNLAFFNMSGSGYDQHGAIRGRTLTYLKAQGVDCGHGGVADRLTIDVDNVCGGHALLYRNGTRYAARQNWTMHNLNGLLADGRYFQIQSIYEGRENTLVDYMLANYKVALILRQDGGGSVVKYDARHSARIGGTRAVASVVCVKAGGATIPAKKYCPTCGQEIKQCT